MKKILSLRLAGLVAGLAIVITSFSQYSALTMNVNRHKLIDAAAGLVKNESDKLAIESLRLINARMFKDFTRSVKKATGISVSQSGTSTFVFFNADNARQRICYDSKGRRNYSIKYYDVDQIPQDVAELVSSEFPKYTLLRGCEVEVNGKIAHLVDIESSTSFKTIRVVDDHYQIYSSVTK